MSGKKSLYKVIRLSEVLSENLRIEVVIAELKKGEEMFSLSSRLATYTFDSKTHLFVLLKDSFIAKYVSSKFDDVLTLNLDDFELSEINFYSNENSIAYIHKEYSALRNEKQIFENVKSDFELENAIHECILHFNLDMYFYSIFSYIFYKERERRNDKLNIEHIFKIFKSLSAALLFSLCQLRTRYFFNLTSTDELVFNNEYADVIEHFGLMQYQIVVYVNCRKNIQQTILSAFNEGHDEESGSLTEFPIFFTHCLYIAYNLALKRIELNISNRNLLAHEFFNLGNISVIKLFPTPLGMINISNLVKIANEGGMDEYIDEYFSFNRILRVKEELVKKQLGTRFIFSDQGSGEIFFYKRRVKDKYDIGFGELDRKDPLKALLNQCQMNLFRL